MIITCPVVQIEKKRNLTISVIRHQLSKHQPVTYYTTDYIHEAGEFDPLQIPYLIPSYT
jgi:hypothetical protein